MLRMLVCAVLRDATLRCVCGTRDVSELGALDFDARATCAREKTSCGLRVGGRRSACLRVALRRILLKIFLRLLQGRHWDLNPKRGADPPPKKR